MAESFCRMEMTEAVLDCCEMAFESDPDEQEAQQQGALFGGEPASSANQNCGTPPDSQPPAVCTVGCAERWNPLVEDCGQYLADFQPLTEACELQAQEFLGEAPSTVMVSGLVVHPDDNGNYSIAPRTIGGRPYWTKVRHCLCLMFPPPVGLRQCLSLRSLVVPGRLPLRGQRATSGLRCRGEPAQL